MAKQKQPAQQKLNPIPSNPELDKLADDLKKADEESKKNLKENPPEEKPQEKRKYTKRNTVDTSAILNSPFYQNLMSKKEETLLRFITMPLGNIKAYYSAKYPDKKDRIESECSFTQTELNDLKFWTNTLFDLYMPDMVKHIKLIVTVIGAGTILAIYGGKFMQVKEITKPVETKKEEIKQDESKK